MIQRFEEEIDKLRTRIIKMGSIVAEQVEYAFRALNEPNPSLAALVEERDAKVDKLDLKIEKQCQRIFALQQPVASDLRLIMSAMKINNELERIGDLATSIARATVSLAPFRAQLEQLELKQMTDSVATMVQRTIDSIVNNDPSLAVVVLRSDTRVDQLEQKIMGHTITLMQEDHDFIPAGAQIIVQLRNMERLADHATNIAEDVIFLTEATMFRHRFDPEALAELQRKIEAEDEGDSLQDV